MPLDMKSFAQLSGRPASPQMNRPGTPSRRQLGAMAKVNKADLRPASRQQQHVPAQTQNSGQRRGPFQQQHVKFDNQDQYGTDAESIDTTIASGPPPAYHQNGYESHQNGDATQYDDGEQEEYEDDEDEQYSEFGNPQYDEQVGSQVPAELLGQINDLNKSAGVYIEGDSYPTTTSGINEDTLQSRQIVDQEQAAEEDRSHVSPSPSRPRANGQLRHAFPQQQNSRPSSALGVARPKPGSHSFYQQGASNEDPGNPKLSSTPPAPVQPRALSDPRHGQTPGHNQDMPPASLFAPRNEGIQPMPHRQTMQALPQRGPGARTRGIINSLPSNPQISHMNLTPPQHTRAAPSQHANVYPTPPAHPAVNIVPQNERPSTPTEDYDVPDLYKMDYNELKNEDFDTDPRRHDPVLSGDMLNKPLDHRLQYVRKSLATEDQARFFRSLPTAEWEESGDWFLHQFETVIKRTREARHAKRKLAQEFEKEVEKRHRHVDKRIHHVDEAMQQMSAHGQGLIPHPSPGPPRRR